ncbi:MAG: anthranilate phosphoribosyltransferase [Saprospiraceae bacterium]|nr:anthranilate phosphoribosyltransferase [Saprospiraceae bacterium]
MKPLLLRLYQHETLSREEAKSMLMKISAGAFDPIQVASFVTVFNVRPITLEEIQGFRDAMLELCVKVDIGGVDTIDIVGTGGDGKNTFNISTLSAVVVAGAGYKVSKHGSYGVSSSVGSSDVLMAMGYEFTNDSDKLKRQLDEANICFLHAPLFHPAMKEVVPIRRALKVPTFFNMLGPLVNPLQPNYQLFGTFSLALSRMYQYIMQETGRQFSIVYALDGYDEISLTGQFKLRTNQSEQLMDAGDLGMDVLTQADLHGGDTAEEAATIFSNVLANECTAAQLSVVSANAGVAINCIKPEQSLEDCVAEARESIISKKAQATFHKLVAI